MTESFLDTMPPCYTGHHHLAYYFVVVDLEFLMEASCQLAHAP